MSDVIVGIDLGTTNSLVAVCENGRPRVLHEESGSAIVPSVIHWGENESQPTVGLEARKQRLRDAAHTATSVKRFMGRGKTDLAPDSLSAVDTSHSTEQNILIKLGTRSVSAIELSAEILKRLKALAENSLGHGIKKAVITVPAYFNDSQRSATKVAGQLAGLDVVRIVNEPTAAALAYGLDRKKKCTIVVYDLGGGTFDVSVLKLHDGIFDVLSTGGDTQLGGDDFDRALAEILIKQLTEKKVKPALLQTIEMKATLVEIAEQMKMQLSSQSAATAQITVGKKAYEVRVTRDEFEAAISPLVEKTAKIAAQALEDAKISKSDVDDVIMVGGSTRTPLVRKLVREFFGKELNLSLNPDEVVALGAAIQADILSGKNQDMVLLDVVPLSLGIETYGGTIGKIIHRNQKIPCAAQETFTTHVDGQRNVLIHVLQGEREMASDCRSLARFDLKGLPPMPAGLPKIQVTFLVDANGILVVKAKELATETEAQIEVKPTYGMTDEQVEKMLMDSFENAETDMRERQLIEARVEAEGVIKAAEKLLQQAAPLATADEIRETKTEVDTVRVLMAGNDYVAIRNALEKLESVAKPMAEKVMNQAVAQKLKQKRIEEVLKKQ